MDVISLRELTILFVEDEKTIREQVTETLGIFFNNVVTASDCTEAYNVYQDSNIDIILSDIKLVRCNGLELVRRIRETDYYTPIIMLTGHSDQNTLIEAANAGIDGYILKPINLNDFLTTCSRVLNKGTKATSIKLNQDFYYDNKTKALYKNGQIVALGAKEQQLLRLLINNNGKTLSKQDIERSIWPFEDITDSALKNLLNRFKKKTNDTLITCVKGSGWRLVIED